jgi:hypothetical protein
MKKYGKWSNRSLKKWNKVQDPNKSWIFEFLLFNEKKLYKKKKPLNYFKSDIPYNAFKKLSDLKKKSKNLSF